MRNAGRRCFGIFIAIAIIYILIGGVIVTLNKDKDKTGVLENAEWVATSKSWFDRQLCRWVELCGTAHISSKNWVSDDIPPPPPPPSPAPDPSDYWHSGSEDPDSWDDEERRRRDIPQYVLDYAPYVHLFSGEQFWPGDLADHLHHTKPYINYTEIVDLDHAINLTNLDELNDYRGSIHGRYAYLQSNDNVEERPEWLGGAKNIPKAPKVRHPYPDQGDDEFPWPDDDDTIAENGLLSEEQQSPINVQGAIVGPSHHRKLNASTNGRCGGWTGFTCKGSNFGNCCSIYGWCGSGEEYCGEACEGLAGECNNPFEPRPRPHTELRRRRIIKSSATNAALRDSLLSKNSSTPVGKSSAPAILIVVPKPDGIVDAFWFFFYSYNLGQKVFNIRFGNHVGDWEHTMIRFRHGIPQTVFLSEHDFGAAYHYRDLEKYIPDPNSPPDSGAFLGTWSNLTAASPASEAKRPVIYSAVGSHAMYATPGLHPYILPWGLLHDQTDRGPLWDPALNFQGFVYNYSTASASSSVLTPYAPTGWFDYAGHWGDKYYPLSDPRQYRLVGQYHYVNGPVGPKFKNLGRRGVCQVVGGSDDPEDDGRGSKKATGEEGGNPVIKCKVRDWVGRDEFGRRKFRAPVGPPPTSTVVPRVSSAVPMPSSAPGSDSDGAVVGGGNSLGWDLDGGSEGNVPGEVIEDGGLPGGNVTDDAWPQPRH